MAYVGLARKWRPQTFDDLVGQEHIAITLANAIRKSRISQGYLFTGTRGIGKTSAARILAKALRCATPVEPSVPCNRPACNDCVEISEGRSVDVLEIDGASNNGVDAVREIRENVKYLPASGKYKIYIIDEVHMLTTAAFNALLKTLEEPPPHVIFIFATTDSQKIPETVLSRCQRFDFRRVSQKDLRERLVRICKAESLTIAPDALAMLAREAEGSMRDAVSLLDQVISVAEGKEITAREIASALGLVDKQTVLDCVAGILRREPMKAVEAVGKIHLHGFDLKQLAREVLRVLRTVMVSKLLEESRAEASAYLELSDADLADVKALLDARSLEDLDMLFRMLNSGIEDVARSPVPKLVMDALVIKMASAEELVALRDLASPADFGSSGSGPSKSAGDAPPRAAERGGVAEAPAGPRDVRWWRGVVDAVKAQKPLFGTMLEHLSFVSAVDEGGRIAVTLAFTQNTAFHAEQLQAANNRAPLLQAMTGHAGRPLALYYQKQEAEDAGSPQPKSLAEIEEEGKRADSEERRRKVLDSEAIQATQRLLGAKLEKLEVKEGERIK